MRILLVDDQILFRELLANMLSSVPDCTVVGQASGVAEAVALSRSLQPDIILMDFVLPDGTGLDATRLIHHELPNAKIVFLTVYDNDEYLLAAISLGAKGYLLKDTSVSAMLDYLHSVEHGEVAISPVIAGRVLTEVVRKSQLPPQEPTLREVLTPRERDVLRELAKGGSNREIAKRLVIAENTVKNHMRAILAKLGVRSRREAVEAARRWQL